MVNSARLPKRLRQNRNLRVKLLTGRRCANRAILTRSPRPESLTFENNSFQCGAPMKKHYLHLSAYPCDACDGPVVAGSTAVRENEISKETDIRQVGAICLSCGHRQSGPTEPARARHLLPIEWDPVSPNGAGGLTTTLVEALNRAEPH